MATDKDEDHPAMPGGLVPLDQWKPPETSVHRTLRSAFLDIVGQLRPGEGADGSAFRSLDQLPPLSPAILDEVAPAPDPAVLARVLLPWLNEARGPVPAGRTPVLVFPPFSRVPEALACSGRRLLVPPPDLCVTEAEAARWWDGALSGEPWVLPDLADFWFRHRAGLALLREFLSRLALDQVGDGIVGCSSWCWAFWNHFSPGLPVTPVTPAPLTGERLSRWLSFLSRDANGRPVTARMSHDGLYVLPAPDDDSDCKYSRFARDLAALSRGNPGVALAIWRQRLRSLPDDDTGRKNRETDAGAGRQCWVAPLGQASLPALPAEADVSAGHVLHALLLHNGLNADELAVVTGLSQQEVRLALAPLLRAELAAPDAERGCYRVRPLGYPAVRRYLQARGYLVDAF